MVMINRDGRRIQAILYLDFSLFGGSHSLSVVILIIILIFITIIFVFIFQQFLYLVTHRQETQATLEALIQTVT